MNLKLCILLCVLAVNQVQSQQARIIGQPGAATLAKNNVAFFTRTSRVSPMCSGGLIFSKWIITSASCVKNLSPAQIRYKVVGNEITAPSANDPDNYVTGQLIDRIIPHPGFSELNLANDIALVSAQTPLDGSFDPYIIGRVYQNLVGQMFTMRGFGATAAGIQTGAIQINEETIIVEPISQCRKDFPSVPGNKLCSLGAKVCRGDQGGVLVSPITDELVGIISTPAIVLQSCAVPIRPSILFTNINIYRSWIQSQIGGSI